jgi:7,8-dihydroneopterin aldolase/epimerase/oxygenase
MGPMDRIEIRGLRVMMSVGVLTFEHDSLQPVEVDVEVLVAVGAGADDDLSTSVDYGALTGRIVAALQAQHVELLERAADVVARTVLEDPVAKGVTVTIRKLRPPVPFDLGHAAVHIERTR